MDFRKLLSEFPLVAILRGLAPDNAMAIGEALVGAGFRIIEVPLNSPQPFVSIERLAKAFPDAMIGAGTVLDPKDVDRVRDAGGRLIVMPHSDPEVIRRAGALGLSCTPGVATPSEGFAALRAGADAIKLFPAEAMPPAVVRAWRAVFPKDAMFLPVGGIKPDTMKAFVEAGANGFGLGSALFTPSLSARDVSQNAKTFAEAWRSLAV
jgi:2-dehydro-3-deoxyphosphogalactonate aldolase